MQKSNSEAGVLYVVATPIGNLSDISERALSVLRQADFILAEDTRRTKTLLQRFAINGANLQSFHEHNESAKLDQVFAYLEQGKQIALVSDAGTPLISDPGYGLVHKAHELGFKVEPIPGACAAIAALSASGLPTDAFFFAGFLPAKSAKRQMELKALQQQLGTLVFYESSHRIIAFLQDCLEILGDRPAVLAREITKLHETIFSAELSALVDFVANDANQQKGEFVVLISGALKKEAESNDSERDRVLQILLSELPVKQAASLTAKIVGEKKNSVYQRALELK